MRALLTFYQNHFDTLSGGDEKYAPFKGYFFHQRVDEAAISSLLKAGEEMCIESVWDFLSCMRVLLSALICMRFEGQFEGQVEGQVDEKLLLQGRACYRKILQKGFWKTFQLGTALSELCAHLLGEEGKQIAIEQLVSGATLLETAGYAPGGQVPHPPLGAELALIWIYLGAIYDNQPLLTAGMGGAFFLMHLFDQRGVPFHALWLRESTFCPLTLYSSYALLFSVCSHLQSGTGSGTGSGAKSAFLAKTLLAKLETLSGESPKQFSLFPPLLASLFNQRFPPSPQEGGQRGGQRGGQAPVFPQEIDRSLGFLRYDHGSLSLACSASGVNTGLGAIHKGSLEVVSFGPHFFPLADPRCYGLYRTCSGVEEGFKDLIIEKERGRCRFQGWSRLVSPLTCQVTCQGTNQNFSSAQPGKHWIFFSIQAKGDQVELDVAFSTYHKSDPLAFVFFIRAQSAHIQETPPFFPRSLRQFQGDSAQIIFEKAGEKVTITPHEKGEMLLIPLAGKEHFWSADFLVAFVVKQKLKHYSWTIE